MKEIIIFLFLILLINPLKSQWSNNPDRDIAISLTQAGGIGDKNKKMVSDGSGGIIEAWRDFRSGSNADIFIQRIDSDGVAKWTVNGINLSNTSQNESSVDLTNDGFGGAVIVWNSGNSNPKKLLIQHINKDGVIQWNAGGIIIKQGALGIIRVVSDAQGGAIMCWNEVINSKLGLKAQRINSNAQFLWDPNGVKIQLDSNYGMRTDFKIISDGFNGAVISFDAIYSYSKIFAQRLNSNGQRLWGETFCVTIYTSQGSDKIVSFPNLCSDGAGGAIIKFTKGLDPFSLNEPVTLYVQKVNSSGIIQWAANGIPVNNEDTVYYSSSIISDGSGGAITCWQDNPDYQPFVDIYSQKINSNGSVQWGVNGIQITDAIGNDSSPDIESDGSGGAVICWDGLNLSIPNGTKDIFAQRIFSNGTFQWTDKGVVVCSKPQTQYASNIVMQSPGSFIISYNEMTYLYCNRITTKDISLTGLIQGFYNANTNLSVRDTINLNIRQSVSPYAIVNMYKGQLDEFGFRKFYVPYTDTYTPYFLQASHRNTIETWSASTIILTSSESFSYNFTDLQSKAFGNNLINVDNSPVRYAFYNGDVNQDGIVDVTDEALIDNNAFNFISGYLSTDLNGDQFIDLADLVIADNNVFNFVVKIVP